MVDVNKLFGKLMDSGFAGGVAGGLASSLLTSKSGRKMGKKALKVGGVAAVGALAYTAFQRYNNPQAAAAASPAADNSSIDEILSAPPGSAFLPEENNQKASDALGLTLVRAMIAAARADGRLDAQESQIIFQKINSLGLDSESQNLLVQEMGHPVDVDAIVNSASSPEIEIAAEIYIASLVAIEVDNTAEEAYLAMLAARMQLPPGLVTELEAQVAAQKSFAQ